MDQPPASGRLMIAGFVGGTIGGALSLALWLLAGAIGMPTEVSVMGQLESNIMWFQFVGVSAFFGLAAGVVAGFFRSKGNGFTTFRAIALVVLVASMILPIAQPGDVAWSTRIVLMVTHVIVFITVVKSVQREMQQPHS
jgi:hypothetical protein